MILSRSSAEAQSARAGADSGYDTAVEFAWGLDLILDGIDRLRRAAYRGER